MFEGYKNVKVLEEPYPFGPLNPRILDPFLIICLIAVLFILFPRNVSAFYAQLSPKKVSPGDAFLIKVRGAENPDIAASLAGKEFFFGNCGEGCFVAIGAVSIETKTGSHAVKLEVGKKKMKLKLLVKRKKFAKREITLPEDKVFLKPDDLDRVEKENERLRIIFSTISGRLRDGDFASPLDNTVTTTFGTKRIMNGKWASRHRGVDISGREGEEVRAANSGRVVLEEDLFFGGNTIILDHGEGIHTVYMHLSKFDVKPGDVVDKGDVIGLVGSSGRSIGPHLHFGAKLQDINVNPVSLLKLKL